MTSERAVFPAMPSPSFPSVSVLPAHRLTGAKLVFPDTDVLSCDGEDVSGLDRSSSVVGNVLCVDDKHYFWLQRKLRATSTQGSLRVGFCLKDPGHRKQDALNSSEFEVLVTPFDSSVAIGDKKNEQRVQMVAIRVENLSDFMESPELAVLQYISSFYSDTAARSEQIPVSMILAADSFHVFVVMPYDEVASSSLFDYCLAQPGAVVPETDALLIFRQILQGLRSLQTMQLCHRNLSLESIVLQKIVGSSIDCLDTSPQFEYCCKIRDFGCASRIPCTADGTVVHMLKPLPLMSSCNVQYIAPEVWNGGNADEKELGPRPFDGYAADLWSAGVILLALLFGMESIFVAPVPEDRLFKLICVDGHVKDFATHRSIVLSDNVMDLLQRLLRCDPNDRPTLAEVQQHPWVVGEG